MSCSVRSMPDDWRNRRKAEFPAVIRPHKVPSTYFHNPGGYHEYEFPQENGAFDLPEAGGLGAAPPSCGAQVCYWDIQRISG